MCCNICTEDPIREPKINFSFPFYATFRPKIFLLPLLNNFDPILTWKTLDLTPVRKYREQVNMKRPFALRFIANMSLFSCFKRLNGMLHENDLHREFKSSMMLVIPSEFKSLVQCSAHKQSALASGTLLSTATPTQGRASSGIKGRHKEPPLKTKLTNITSNPPSILLT